MDQTRPIVKVLVVLLDTKKKGREWVARCPAHENEGPLLHFREAEDGKVPMTYRAGCSQEAIVKGFGLTFQVRPTRPANEIHDSATHVLATQA